MLIAGVKLVLSFCVCSVLAYSHQRQWRGQAPSTTESPFENSANDIYYGNLKLRHHSRFPNLDRVMTKIDNMQQTNNKKTSTIDNYNNYYNNGRVKVRHQGYNYRTTTTTTTTTTTPSDGLFGEDYGEYDDEEQNNEYDEWEDEDNVDDEYDEETDDKVSFLDGNNENEWQAEEATEPTVNAPVSSLTKFKWDNYGTRSRVEESRRQMLHLKPNSDQKDTNAVIEHYMKVRQQGQCRNPLPKVIPVQSEHPDTSKSYTPHCTILHRCAADTGCCSTFDTQCGPKTKVPVHLYFYTKTLGVAGTSVVKLLFYNHTECACLEKNKTGSSVQNAPHSGLALRSAQPENFMKKCKCPEEFSARFRYDSGCSCDCEEHNQDCHRMKKGKEFFSLTDRMCIMEKECGVPLCEYGIYMRQIGRCPRKQEKLDSYRKLTLN